jgi:hypothetical protein
MVLVSVAIRRAGAAPSLSSRQQRRTLQHRSFMSTQPLLEPTEDSHFFLILGKPGGGKGTISGKILKVCCCCVCVLLCIVVVVVVANGWNCCFRTV